MDYQDCVTTRQPKQNNGGMASNVKIPYLLAKQLCQLYHDTSVIIESLGEATESLLKIEKMSLTVIKDALYTFIYTCGFDENSTLPCTATMIQLQRLFSTTVNVIKMKSAEDMSDLSLPGKFTVSYLHPEFLLSICKLWFFPWLFEADLRGFHRNIMNAIKGINARICKHHTNLWANFESHFKGFLEYFINNAIRQLSEDGENRITLSLLANTFDSVHSAAAGIFFSSFDIAFCPADFPGSLIFVTRLLETTVQMAAKSIYMSNSTPSNALTAVISSENLENIRFVVRIVAAHVHKYFREELLELENIRVPVSQLLAASLTVLSIPAFPKDVLNAVGLLAGTFIFSAGTETCYDLCMGIANSSMSVAVKSVNIGELQGILPAAIGFANRLCSKGSSGLVSKVDIDSLVGNITLQGAFALFRGIVSHCVSLADALSPQNSVKSGILVPFLPLEGNQQANEVKTVFYSVILPFIFVFCANLLAEGPLSIVQRVSGNAFGTKIVSQVMSSVSLDVQFIALQTLDLCVRYLVAVYRPFEKNPSTLPACLDLINNDQHMELLRVIVAVVSEPTDVSASTATAALTPVADSDNLSCIYGVLLDFGKSLSCLFGSQSGYNPLLSISDAVRTALGGPSAACVGSRSAFQMLSVLVQRGTYEELRGWLAEHYSALEARKRKHDCDSVITKSDPYMAFSQDLLLATTSTRVRSLAGDIFSTTAAIHAAHSPNSFKRYVTVPLAAALLGASVRTVRTDGVTLGAAAVADPLVATAVASHALLPLLRRCSNASSAQRGLRVVSSIISSLDMIDAERKCMGVNDRPGYVNAVVNILYRAKSSGVSTGEFINVNSPLFQTFTKIPFIDIEKNDCTSVVLEALCSYDSVLRNNALLLLSQAGIPADPCDRVTLMQCCLVVDFFSNFFQQGGDTTARNGLLFTLNLWISRLCHSVVSTPVISAGGGVEGVEYRTYVKMIIDHFFSLLDLCVQQMLEWPIYMSDCGSGTGSVVSLRNERRYVALSLLDQLYGALLPLLGFHKKSDLISSHQSPLSERSEENSRAFQMVASNLYGDFEARLLPIGKLRAPLQTMLGDGWDDARRAAAAVVRRFIGVLPSGESTLAVFLSPDNDLQSLINTLARSLCSCRHKDARQAVEVLGLLIGRNTAAGVKVMLNIPFTSYNLSCEVGTSDAALPFLDALCAQLESICAVDSRVDSRNRLLLNPVHGRVYLCGTLLAAEGALTPKHEAVTTARRLLRTCVTVMRFCSVFVGGTYAGQEGGQAVDCRGHAFGLSDAKRETDRVVVNNSWNGIRSALSVLEQLILRHTHVGVFSPEEVKIACDALIEILLTTKHNGVIGKGREAHRRICISLLRCPPAASDSAMSFAHRDIPALLTSDSLLCDAVWGLDAGAEDANKRILRRAQGLPFALLPILEAEAAVNSKGGVNPQEVRDCKGSCRNISVIFPYVMRKLIDFAYPIVEASSKGNDSIVAELETRMARAVSAVYILKYIVDKATLAPLLLGASTGAVSAVFPDALGAKSSFLQDCFIIALVGLRAANWHVRNSSMMLFAATVGRIVGVTHAQNRNMARSQEVYSGIMRISRAVVSSSSSDTLEKTDGTAQHALSVVHAGLDLRSLRELDLTFRTGVRFAVTALCEALEVRSGAYAGSALFPLLLMFSQLSPAEMSDRAVVVDELLALCRSCSRSANLSVRSASAASFVALLPPNRIENSFSSCVGPYLKILCNSDGDENAMHGAALHLRHLYVTYVGSLDTSPVSMLCLPQQDEFSLHSTAGEVLHRELVNALLQNGLLRAESPTTVAALLVLIADLAAAEECDGVAMRLVQLGLTLSIPFIDFIDDTKTGHGTCVATHHPLCYQILHSADLAQVSSATAFLLFIAVSRFAISGAEQPKLLISFFARYGSAFLPAYIERSVSTVLWLAERLSQTREGQWCKLVFMRRTLSRLIGHRGGVARVLAASPAAMQSAWTTILLGCEISQVSDSFSFKSLQRGAALRFCTLLLVSSGGDLKVLGLTSGMIGEAFDHTLRLLQTQEASSRSKSASEHSYSLMFMAACMTVCEVASTERQEALCAVLREASDSGSDIRLRFAVVTSLEIMRNNCGTHLSVRPLLRALALRLMFDDEETVRAAACTVVSSDVGAPYTLAQPVAATRCVAALRADIQKDAERAPELGRFIEQVLLETDKDKSAGEGSESDSDESEEELELFAEEDPNIFWEQPIMTSWCALIKGINRQELFPLSSL